MGLWTIADFENSKVIIKYNDHVDVCSLFIWFLNFFWCGAHIYNNVTLNNLSFMSMNIFHGIFLDSRILYYTMLMHF
jgi:hypothetical protein